MPKPPSKGIAAPADAIRGIALSFDGVREVDHWGRPAFRTTRRIFAVIRPDGLWLHLPEERKEFLFAADPATFVKYMWGRHPELLLQAERVSKTELTALLREAYEHALPEKKEGGRPRLSRKRKT
jgi:hypothetical protein